MYQTDFPPEELAERRARVLDAIGNQAVAVLQGAPAVRGFEAFRQFNDFYYLCGVELPHGYLLLDGRSRKTTLFSPDPATIHASSEGPSLADQDPQTITRLTGLEAVCPAQTFSAHLADVRTLYTPHSPSEGAASSRGELLRADRIAASDLWDCELPRQARFAALLHARHPNAEIRGLIPILDRLRLIKSARELDLLRRAARLTGLGLIEAIRSTRPGVMEYQLAAIAYYVFLVNGARGEGYRAIVAGGPNAWYSHYYRNDCPLRDGELVLMDYAPDYRYYTSDIGRMWPVNGTYSPLQRELYGFVVEYHKAVLQHIRPGLMAAAVTDAAAAQMREVVNATQFSKPVYEAAARKMLESRGHLSHPVGMAVHDVGDYYSVPLAPGMVFSVDPQMWVPEEKLYIRVEDTVAVTHDGIENLTGFVPLDLDDVEALIHQDGLLQAHPRLLL